MNRAVEPRGSDAYDAAMDALVPTGVRDAYEAKVRELVDRNEDAAPSYRKAVHALADRESAATATLPEGD